MPHSITGETLQARSEDHGEPGARQWRRALLSGVQTSHGEHSAGGRAAACQARAQTRPRSPPRRRSAESPVAKPHSVGRPASYRHVHPQLDGRRRVGRHPERPVGRPRTARRTRRTPWPPGRRRSGPAPARTGGGRGGSKRMAPALSTPIGHRDHDGRCRPRPGGRRHLPRAIAEGGHRRHPLRRSARRVPRPSERMRTSSGPVTRWSEPARRYGSAQWASERSSSGAA